MSWEKLPAIQSNGPACLTCGCGAHDTMGMDALLGVGFGDVTVTRDGALIYSEMEQEHAVKRSEEWPSLWTGAGAESAAAQDPDHDWRVHFNAPLYEAEYQRQGDKHWVLIKKGPGFA